MPKRRVGKVYLVGAGPGDPELITLKGKRVLGMADVVYYDQLAHPNLLLYASNATCVDVGKKKGQHQKLQAEINDLLVSSAKKGQTVVRLKGGDPMIFGRAGEELRTLRQHGISYEVVPGVTSAVAVPTYAGIPLTHRKMSRSVAFVTGTVHDGSDLNQQDYPEADTLVFLMASTHLESLLSRVQSIPRFSADTPAAFIYRGATAQQQVIVATVATLAERKKSAGLSTPAIVVVGEVASLADDLSWVEHLPLFGRRVHLLRTQSQASPWAERLQEEGAEVLLTPLIEIKTRDSVELGIAEAFTHDLEYCVFSSPNAVDNFFKPLLASGKDLRVLSGVTLCSVGRKTSESLLAYGLRADVEASQFGAEGLLDVMPRSLEGKRILLPASSQSTPAMREGLLARGGIVDFLPVYDTLPSQSSWPVLLDGDFVVFSSTSTVSHFFERFSNPPQNLRYVAVGRSTEAACREKGLAVDVLPEASADALVDFLRNTN